MTLEKLQAEMISAMKNKDKERKETISSLVQAVKKFGIDNRCKDNISEEQVDAVILKEKKTMQEMIDTCPVEREDLARGYRAKMQVIDEFAPVLLTEEGEIIDFVNDLGIDITNANRGAIMKLLATNLKGKTDMALVSKVVGEMLE